VLGVVLLLLVPSARAQYFGRNKVQYDRFEFSVIETPHFELYYYAAEEDAARIAATLAERWYARLSVVLAHQFESRCPIILYASHSHFAQTTIVPDAIPDGVGGFTDHLAGRVVLPFAAGLGETEHVLGHEIVHAFQRDILKRRARTLRSLPLWFSEGMAEYLSLDGLDANTLMWLRDAAATGRLPTIAELDSPRYFPYRYGQALWAFLGHKYGEATIRAALTSRQRDGRGRLRESTGTDLTTLSNEWHTFIRETVGKAEPGGHDDSLERVIAPGRGGRFNIAPALSPDGRRLVFLSERDGYSLDAYYADATSGAILGKLISMATDGHFDSLQFVDSAGDWDRTGRSFVLATVRDGRPVLTIFDMTSAEPRAEIPVRDVDQIFSPTWSPDGRRIAFSGLRGGFSDLFVLEVSTGETTAVTNDPYSDLQPSWSPDGASLVFATDRFSSSLETMTFGRYELATVDVASGAIRPVRGNPTGKNIDPHWSPDGRGVYFVSDAGGISNLYRVEIQTGNIQQITDVASGVSGIGALSPAVSIGAHGKQAALSVYSKGAYEIVVRALPEAASTSSSDGPAATGAGAGTPADSGGHAAADPGGPTPADSGGRAAADISAPPSGPAPGPAGVLAPRLERYPSRAYVPALSIAQVGAPYLSAGGGAFGSFLRGGISVGFGDLLGQQELDTAVQVGKASTDNAVSATYLNRRSRWNWGLSGGWIPALVGATSVVSHGTTADGTATVIDSNDVLQQIHRQAAAIVAYPFNRSQRLEGSLGIDSIAFGRRTTTTVYSAATGSTLSQSSAQGVAAPTATIIQAGAALVHDTSVFGPVSPLLGQRYRLAVTPALGGVRVLTTLADYRRYFTVARPFTLAVRFDAVARTGRDAADPRLLPLVWNMRDYIRGIGTDNDTIRTSRFAIANGELRVPVAALVRSRVDNLPLEGFSFAECGRFWIPQPSASALGARAMCSVGAGVRINAAGFIFELNGARPVAPGENGWRVGVNFQPGF
jgi:Tol biopolymer transport system component